MPAPEWLDQYTALTAGAGLVDFSDRTLVEIGGDDRASFLHNFCTNDIRKLPAGAGCEAFVTSAQGKILAHVLVFSGQQSLVLETVPEQAKKLIEHLDRYLIREKVTLRDRSEEWTEMLLAGRASEPLLSGLIGGAAPEVLLSSAEVVLAGREAWIRRVDIVGPVGFLIDCRKRDRAHIFETLRQAGALVCETEALEAARIEAGFPFFGRDISEKNLPQELGRDDRTISFVKGCYLGQETVARIDALGHVNKTLVGVHFNGAEIPPVGAELRAAEQVVGEVTSAAYSPLLSGPLALAYIRRGHNTPGSELTSQFGSAEVVKLPIARV
jgi:folate-binding protein YgfZ